MLKNCEKWFNPKIKYYSSFITSGGNAPHILCDKWYWVSVQSIWKDRDVVYYLPSNNNKASFNNPLFVGMRSCTPIYVPDDYAYSQIDEMVVQARKFSRDTLFLVRIGPIATVLISRLSKLGYQCIDIG